MTIVGGLRIIDSNAQTGTTWWNWTIFFGNVKYGWSRRIDVVGVVGVLVYNAIIVFHINATIALRVYFL
jgi:hypothetical protein